MKSVFRPCLVARSRRDVKYRDYDVSVPCLPILKVRWHSFIVMRLLVSRRRVRVGCVSSCLLWVSVCACRSCRLGSALRRGSEEEGGLVLCDSRQRVGQLACSVQDTCGVLARKYQPGGLVVGDPATADVALTLKL